MPACLVRMLLLKSGIESNPGPPGPRRYRMTTIYECSVCKSIINDKREQSVLCSKCKNWCHYNSQANKNCSKLKSIKDYDRGYSCPTCLTLPTPRHIPSSSTPPQQASTIDSFKLEMKIGQININGIQSKSTELCSWLLENNVKVCAVQETKLQAKSNTPSFPQYTFLRKDRQNKTGGGLALLIHESVTFIPLPDPPADPHLEYQGIQIENLKIVNIYIPPVSSCSTPNYTPDLSRFLPDNDALVLGDLNAHDPLWDPHVNGDLRGSQISDSIDTSNFGVLNDGSATRIPTGDASISAPDLSLASLSILPYTEWTTQKTLGSDHLPILINLETNIKFTTSDNKTFTNFKKAKWSEFYKND